MVLGPLRPTTQHCHCTVAQFPHNVVVCQTWGGMLHLSDIVGIFLSLAAQSLHSKIAATTVATSGFATIFVRTESAMCKLGAL